MIHKSTFRFYIENCSFYKYVVIQFYIYLESESSEELQSEHSDMNSRKPHIRTPDQKLRVFISSTLRELADERTAARESVEKLQLIPVMFELGARPHPPKDLYQAYLFQSDIFVGIYWQSYGWIAENETISGIEDEYRLSGSLPRLIYVKEPSNDREQKLKEMLDDVRSKAGVSYKSFATAEELGKLLTNDLAILLSERFYDSGTSASTLTDKPKAPAILSAAQPALFGREKDAAIITEMLKGPGKHIVTITGQGGIGKTRLATAVARSLSDDFDDGVYFIDLSDVIHEEEIYKIITASFGINLTVDEDPVRKIAGFIGLQKILLVLDNFEQVSFFSEKLASISNDCPNLRTLITSRNSLNLSVENEYRLGALAAPLESDEFGEIIKSPSVQLFSSKALIADPGFELTAENCQDVAKICRLLEGIPLAIGLAAAKVKVYSPSMLLERLNDKFSLLSGGSSDAPARHRTMKTAIEWSYELLSEDEKKLLRRIGIFAESFELDALTEVCSFDIEQPSETVESLIGKYLLIKETGQYDITRFRQAGMFHEFSRELLKASDEVNDIKLRHAMYFLNHSAVAGTSYSGQGTVKLSRKWKPDAANIIQAADTFSQRKMYPELVRLIYSFWQLFWIFDFEADLEKKVNIFEILHSANGLSESDAGKLVWLAGANALSKGDPETAGYLFAVAMDYFRDSGNKSGYAWANHLLATIKSASDQASTEEILSSFEESARLFRETGDYWGECGVLQNTAALEISLKRYKNALKVYEEFDRIAASSGNYSQMAHIRIMKGLIFINKKKFDEALTLLKQGMAFYRDGDPHEELCYALIITSYYFFKTKDDLKAMFMAGAFQNLKQKFGISLWPMIESVEANVVDRVRTVRKPAFRDEYNRALDMGVHKVTSESIAIVERSI